MRTKSPGARGKTSPADAGTKSARTRTRLLDAAAQVLSVKGYAGMRLTDVARVAEIQAPAIYYYFPSREHLIEEVMWFGLADMRKQLTKALDEAPDGLDPMDRIMLAVETHLRHELELSDYTTASIRNAGQLPDAIKLRQHEEQVKYGELWRGLIKAAADEGQVRPTLDRYIAQMLIMGALNWAAEWWSPTRGSLDEVVKVAQSFIRHGLGVAENAPSE